MSEGSVIKALLIQKEIALALDTNRNTRFYRRNPRNIETPQ